jgi:DNA-binding transcriptional ArsR family regulator
MLRARRMQDTTRIKAADLREAEEALGTESLSLSRVLAALADPVRLEIVRALAARGSVACCEIGIDIPNATLSHHLKVLREAGIAKRTPAGTQRLYSLRRAALDARFPGLLDAVLTGR